MLISVSYCLQQAEWHVLYLQQLFYILVQHIAGVTSIYLLHVVKYTLHQFSYDSKYNY